MSGKRRKSLVKDYNSLPFSNPSSKYGAESHQAKKKRQNPDRYITGLSSYNKKSTLLIKDMKEK